MVKLDELIKAFSEALTYEEVVEGEREAKEEAEKIKRELASKEE